MLVALLFGSLACSDLPTEADGPDVDPVLGRLVDPAALPLAVGAPNGVLMLPNASTAEGREAVSAVWAGWGELWQSRHGFKGFGIQ